MRLLVDENIDQAAVERLRSLGNDVVYAKETYQAENDSFLLRRATLEQRTLVTYDTDYGELVHRYGELAPYGVVQFRIHDRLQGDPRINFIVGSVTIWEQWPPGVWSIQFRNPSA